MRDRTAGLDRVLGLAVGVAVAWTAQFACSGTQDRPWPKFEDVKKTVQQHFEAMPNYEPGDIITRSDVLPLFAQLQRLGWTVADRKDILSRIPADGDYLVKQLRGPRGRKFMRQIGSQPDTYDRLERLTRLPNGKRTVSELIRRPGKGSDVIKYLATNPKGIRASKRMAKKAAGSDFHRPTGRIYTQEMLLQGLKKSYEAAKRLAGDAGK